MSWQIILLSLTYIAQFELGHTSPVWKLDKKFSILEFIDEKGKKKKEKSDLWSKISFYTTETIYTNKICEIKKMRRTGKEY